LPALWNPPDSPRRPLLREDWNAPIGADTVNLCLEAARRQRSCGRSIRYVEQRSLVLWLSDVNLLLAALLCAAAALLLPLLPAPVSLVAFLVSAYTGAGMVGRIIGAMNGAGDLFQFWDDGLAYLRRYCLALLVNLLLWVLVLTLLGVPFILLGGLSLLSGASYGPSGVVRSLLLMFVIEAPVVAGLFIWLSPYAAMVTAGVFHDGWSGIPNGIKVAQSRRWTIIGLLLLLILAMAIVGGAVPIFVAGFLPLRKLLRTVLVTIIGAFGLTAILMFYRSSTNTENKAESAGASATSPISAD
jgi:hypothetical protein